MSFSLGEVLVCTHATLWCELCPQEGWLIRSLHDRRMLGDKLLTKRGYECDSEIRTLELLKLRFGDANLHPCEVRTGRCPGGVSIALLSSSVCSSCARLRALPWPCLPLSIGSGCDWYLTQPECAAGLSG